MATLIENGYPIFTDKNGDPLEDGYIFIGEAGLSPVTNPQTAYWDSALTIPAANIRTSGGYPVYQGSPSRLYVDGNYSILVQDSQMNTVYTLLNTTGYVTVPSAAPGFDYSQVVVKSAATITVKSGSRADVNGTEVEVLSDTDLTLPVADTDYYIRLTSGGALSLTTDPGAYSSSLNARYLAGDRILNWAVRRDSVTSYPTKILDIVNLTYVDTSVKGGTVPSVNGKPLYGMDQDVKTTDEPTFKTLTVVDESILISATDIFTLKWGQTDTQGDIFTYLSQFVSSPGLKSGVTGTVEPSPGGGGRIELSYIRASSGTQIDIHDSSGTVRASFISGSGASPATNGAILIVPYS